MWKQFIDQMLCIDGRLSMTKLGAAIKSMPVYLGASVAGISLFSGNGKTALSIGIASAVLRGVGEWIEKAGERNAMKG
jgi:hypothetical protein